MYAGQQASSTGSLPLRELAQTYSMPVLGYPPQYSYTPGAAPMRSPGAATAAHLYTIHQPAPLNRLCLNPSLRTRAVAHELFSYWASCTPYARMAKPLGLLRNRSTHWRGRRLPTAFARWRSFSRLTFASDYRAESGHVRGV